MQSELPPAPWALTPTDAGPFAPARPSMQGRYLLRSERSAAAMRWLDRALGLLPVQAPRLPDRFERILVANWGHLGDVVTTLGAIQALRDRHPGLHVGMIVATAGRPAAESTGLVDQFHVVDHWWVSRKPWSSKQKRRHFRATRDKALCEIRAADYEAAIDFYPFFPPAHPLFYRAGIPIRAGFTSGGFSPLLTHPVGWINAPLPVSEHYRALLDVLHPGAPFAADALRPRRRAETLAPRPVALSDATPYVVLHPGAGATYKEWDIGYWCALAERLLADGPTRRLVTTGAGAAEVAMAARIAAVSPAIVDLAGQLDWQGFVSVIAGAELVVCPDTATGHVAAAVDVPVVSIFTGTNVAEQWQPYTPDSRVLVQDVRCRPCNGPGCSAMACIRGTAPDQVLAAIADLDRTRRARLA